MNDVFRPGYYATAELRVKDPARVEEAKAALAELAAHTLREPGCSIFVFHQDLADPARFLLWERFDDEAALQAHFEEPHTRAYFARDLTELVQAVKTHCLHPAG